jgi:hypothetical protein
LVIAQTTKASIQVKCATFWPARAESSLEITQPVRRDINDGCHSANSEACQDKDDPNLARIKK